MMTSTNNTAENTAIKKYGKPPMIKRGTDSFRPGQLSPVQSTTRLRSLVFRIPSTDVLGTPEEFVAVRAFASAANTVLAGSNLGRTDSVALDRKTWSLKVALTPESELDDPFLSKVFKAMKDTMAEADFLAKGFPGGSPASWSAYIGECPVDKGEL